MRIHKGIDLGELNENLTNLYLRLVDDYNSIKDFDQFEEDRYAVGAAIELVIELIKK